MGKRKLQKIDITNWHLPGGVNFLSLEVSARIMIAKCGGVGRVDAIRIHTSGYKYQSIHRDCITNHIQSQSEKMIAPWFYPVTALLFCS